MGEETASTSKAVDSTSEEVLPVANDLLSHGKRHLLCGEVHKAIDCLQEACQLLSEKYGETADECGEAYFFYGKARLDLSRMESGVLGNALDGVPVPDSTSKTEATETKDEKSEGTEKTELVENPDDVPAEEREDIADKVYDALTEEKTEATKEKTETTKGEGEKMETETSEEKKTEDEKTNEKTDDVATEKETEETKEDEDEKAEDEEGDDDEEGEDEAGDDEEGDENGDATAAAEGEDKAEEEDVSNIQLAWETLDLARVIFSRHKTKEMQLKAAQAHLKLGEVSIELENNEQAVKDFQECLQIQTQYLEPDDRLLAETHYQIGVAYSYDKKFNASRDSLKLAMSVIQAKKAKLEKFIEENKDKQSEKKEGEEDPAEAARQEIEDLNEIIPDIEAKIKDTEDEEVQLKALEKEKEKEQSAAVFATASGFDKPSTSGEAAPIQMKKKTDEPVSVLQPRKRKPEDETPEGEAETKKLRQEDGSGEAGVNNTEPVMNGSHAKETNGTNATNGTNGTNGVADSPEKTEKPIVTKTVEDVQMKEASTEEATA